jgi:hypothetical protein
MKLLGIVLIGLMLIFSGSAPAMANSDGTMSIHEIAQEDAPTAFLEIKKDPTGGFNVHVVTTKFKWRPEMASMKYVPGEGHAHVFLDGRKIMRIYNEWFHLNTFQFATRAGEQLLTVEFVGNDHAPYTIQGSPVGDQKIVDVPADEIQPASSQTPKVLAGVAVILILVLVAFLYRFRSFAYRRS